MSSSDESDKYTDDFITDDDEIISDFVDTLIDLSINEVQEECMDDFDDVELTEPEPEPEPEVKSMKRIHSISSEISNVQKEMADMKLKIQKKCPHRNMKRLKLSDDLWTKECALCGKKINED